MTTDSNYSPDYKSEKRKPEILFVNDAGAVARRKRQIELEREVIDAARARHHVDHSTAPEPIRLEYRSRLCRAIEALEAFEQKQK